MKVNFSFCDEMIGCEGKRPTAVGVQQSKSGKKQIRKSVPGITAPQQACEGNNGSVK